jgi:hypothetical protein
LVADVIPVGSVDHNRAENLGNRDIILHDWQPQMSANSNINEVVRWLDDWVNGIDFRKSGQDQSLGRDVAKKVAEKIAFRSATEHRGATVAWPDNSNTPSPWHPQGYRAWKAEKYGVDAPNYRTGQMLSELSLIGRTAIAAHEIIMTYGTDAPPFTSAAPTGLLSDADKAVKDTEKSTWNSATRPFYEMDDQIAEAVVVDVCYPWVSVYVMDTNRANGV